MNARQQLEAMVRTDRGSQTVWSPGEVHRALDAYRAEVLREAANALACVGPETLASGPQAWTEAIETFRRMADETHPTP